MNKIVLFGGSFNPPHKAHQIIAETLINSFDRVFIIPCGPKYKSTTKLISSEHRIEMVKIAFKNISVYFDFCDLINDIYTPAYLLDKEYKNLYPDDRIYHVVGEDIIAGGHNKCSEIHKIWDYGDDIWNNLNFVVIVRPGYGAKQKDLPPKSMIIEIGDVVGSGTLIRKLIEEGKSIYGLVDSEIEEYIKRNKLYQKGGN